MGHFKVVDVKDRAGFALFLLFLGIVGYWIDPLVDKIACGVFLGIVFVGLFAEN